MTVATGGSNTCTARSSDADFYFYLDPQSGAVDQCSSRESHPPSLPPFPFSDLPAPLVGELELIFPPFFHFRSGRAVGIGWSANATDPITLIGEPIASLFRRRDELLARSSPSPSPSLWRSLLSSFSVGVIPQGNAFIIPAAGATNNLYSELFSPISTTSKEAV